MSIRIDDLTVTFKNGVTAVDHVDLEIPHGIFGLLGENGAGKTTLMRVLTTVLAPTSGKVLLDGTLYCEANYEKIQKKIGYLPQEIDLYPSLTVRECLEYMGDLAGIEKRESKKRIDYYLEKTSLADHQKKKMRQLSGGMKRRVGLVQALLHEPDFLIVDEPTTGLDPEERIRIRNLLVDFAEERTVLFSTHVVEDLMATCNQLAVMKKGRFLYASEGKGNTEWKQWAEAEKDDIALIMRRYGIDWKKKNTHNQHLSVLDYKKQERVKEVAALEEKLEGAQVVLELKEERIESLEKEIEDKHVSIRKEQSEAQKMLNDTKAETRKLQLETTDLRIKNSELRLEYYDNLDQLADKQKEIEAAQKEADKWMMIRDTAKWRTEQAQIKLEEAERLKKELLGAVDGDDYLKEQVIELRYQNQMLREENRSLKDKLEKAYEFMKQFVIGEMNLLEKFWEWIGEKVKDVGRGR